MFFFQFKRKSYPLDIFLVRKVARQQAVFMKIKNTKKTVEVRL